MKSPSQAQIDFATDLLEQLGYDVDDYNLSQMNRDEISALIKELLEERGKRRWGR